MKRLNEFFSSRDGEQKSHRKIPRDEARNIYDLFFSSLHSLLPRTDQQSTQWTQKT